MTTKEFGDPRIAGVVMVHADLIAWSLHKRTDARLRRRVGDALSRLAADGQTPFVKRVTQGPGKGWSRTPLGGNGGVQFYLWWRVEAEKVWARVVRHHDEQGALDMGGGYVAMPAEGLEVLLKEVG